MTASASEAISQPSRSSRPVTTSPPAVSKLTIVIPAYNEERTIGDVLARVAAVRFPVECEILVVDDGSRDRTLEIARASSVDCAAIRVLTKPNGGKGSAVRYGIAHATGDVVVVQDADLEIEPSECVRLLTVLLEDGADVVYGSRFLGKPIEWTSGHLANRALSLLTSLLFLTRVTDMETSHKMVRRQVLSRLYTGVQPVRHRTGDHRQASASWVPHPRSAHRLQSAHQGRRQEDRLAGRPVGRGDPMARAADAARGPARRARGRRVRPGVGAVERRRTLSRPATRGARRLVARTRECPG